MTVISCIVLRLATAAAIAAISQSAFAFDYPTKPVRLIVGVAAGGANDTVARLLAQTLSERLGQPVVVENRPGAGGNIGLEAVVNAPPDGHTLLFATSANALSVSFYDKSSISFARDITPVASLVRGPLIMEVNPSFPAKTIPEFIAYAKANPGKINMASAGIGNTTHVAGELFMMLTGTKFTHVPYRGWGARGSGSHRRAGASLLRRDIGIARACQVGETARIGSDHRAARRCAAERPEHRRVRTGLRGGRLVWDRRAQECTRRGRRQAQQGNQCRSRRSKIEDTTCRPRLHDVRGLIRRV
jgi:hypothetical protein